MKRKIITKSWSNSLERAISMCSNWLQGSLGWNILEYDNFQIWEVYVWLGLLTHMQNTTRSVVRVKKNIYTKIMWLWWRSVGNRNTIEGNWDLINWLMVGGCQVGKLEVQNVCGCFLVSRREDEIQEWGVSAEGGQADHEEETRRN